jgi:hypothetical protein
MKKWYDYFRPRNWGIVKVYRDFENFVDWKKTVRREQANPNSFFNKWKLSRTKLYDVYTTVSLENTDALLPENIQRVKLMEILNPLHKYLDEDLSFAECLDCEFNQFEDDKGSPTLTYLIVYRFRWNKFSIGWMLKSLIILSILIYLIIHFNILSWIISFL